MKIMQLLSILFLLLTSTLLYAEECNEFAPSFLVDGVDKWSGLSVAEIYQQQSRTQASEPSQDNIQGVSLKSLIRPYAKKGVLIVYACDGKSLSFEVRDLLSDASEKQDYYLILSKKNFFKLIAANNSKPMLKKVNQLKLIR